jgi:hypothetical protein
VRAQGRGGDCKKYEIFASRPTTGKKLGRFLRDGYLTQDAQGARSTGGNVEVLLRRRA